jgi:hypothetical protein
VTSVWDVEKRDLFAHHFQPLFVQHRDQADRAAERPPQAVRSSGRADTQEACLDDAVVLG